MTIYYHVTTNLNHDGHFTPRIPMNRCENENTTIPRISVSPSIQDALTAIPGGGGDLHELLDQTHGYVKVIEIDTDKYNIDPVDIYSTDLLFTEALVGDAEITNEVWILSECHIHKNDHYVIAVNDWLEEVRDIIPNDIYDLADEKYEGDYIQCYSDVFDTRVPSCLAITNLTYSFMDLNAFDKTLIVRRPLTALTFWTKQKDRYQLPITLDLVFDTLTITALSPVNLTPYLNDLPDYSSIQI